MEEITIRPIEGKVFGATVSGVDLRSLTDDSFATIHAAFLEHGFLFIPNQHLSADDSVAFGKRFGDLEFGGAPIANQPMRGDGTFGPVLALDSRMMRTNVGNETWHTDSSYKPISSKCGILSAVTVPEEGGQTELADLRSAYAALDDSTKERIETLGAYHSANYSQANDLGDFPGTEVEGILASVYNGEAYLRPLVKLHPETGVKNLFVGRHAFGIPGLERNESRELLRSLMDFVVSDAGRVYSHGWTPGDLLIWDNRCIMHRARPYDYSKPRLLLATRVAGEPASELAYYPEDPEAEGGRIALAAELEMLRREVRGKRYAATTAVR